MAKKTIEELELDSLKQNLNSMTFDEYKKSINESFDECEKSINESFDKLEKSMDEYDRKFKWSFRIFYFLFLIIVAIANYVPWIHV